MNLTIRWRLWREHRRRGREARAADLRRLVMRSYADAAEREALVRAYEDLRSDHD